MNEIGIECRDFNPLSPLFSLFMNNRDHRKIMVIDGKIGFTGGYNLADEYFNYSHPYGQWKDSGLRIEGKAVNTFTELFLEMWNSQEKGRLEDVSKTANLRLIMEMAQKTAETVSSTKKMKNLLLKPNLCLQKRTVLFSLMQICLSIICMSAKMSI